MKETRNWIGVCALAIATLGSLLNGGCDDSSNRSAHGGRATNLLTLTEANFRDQVLSASQPVLVDFWASWCPPCRALAPTIDDIVREFQGRAIIGAVDVDASPALAQKYGITALPTVALFQDGKLIEQAVGLRSKEDYHRMLNHGLARISPAGHPPLTNAVATPAAP